MTGDSRRCSGSALSHGRSLRRRRPRSSGEDHLEALGTLFLVVGEFSGNSAYFLCSGANRNVPWTLRRVAGDRAPRNASDTCGSRQRSQIGAYRPHQQVRTTFLYLSMCVSSVLSSSFRRYTFGKSRCGHYRRSPVAPAPIDRSAWLRRLEGLPKETETIRK